MHTSRSSSTHFPLLRNFETQALLPYRGRGMLRLSSTHGHLTAGLVTSGSTLSFTTPIIPNNIAQARRCDLAPSLSQAPRGQPTPTRQVMALPWSQQPLKNRCEAGYLGQQRTPSLHSPEGDT